MKIEYKLPTEHQKYYVDGKIVPSVTTVLSILGSDSLTKWANRIGFQKIHLEDSLQFSSNVGTLAHLLIEVFLNGQIDEFDMNKFYRLNKSYTNEMIDQSIYAFESFESFYNDNKNDIQVLFTEKQMVSEKYGFGGTIDLGFTYKGIPMLGDYKTSNYFNRKMFFQTAAYLYMAKEYNLDFQKVAIFKLPKTPKDEFDIKMMKAENLKPYFRYFLKCLEIYEMNKFFKDGLYH